MTDWTWGVRERKESEMTSNVLASAIGKMEFQFPKMENTGKGGGHQDLGFKTC